MIAAFIFYDILLVAGIVHHDALLFPYFSFSFFDNDPSSQNKCIRVLLATEKNLINKECNSRVFHANYNDKVFRVMIQLPCGFTGLVQLNSYEIYLKHF
jgi:hypothetical protein